MTLKLKTPPFGYEEINDWFSYCKESGAVLWKKKPAKKILIGQVAGSKNNGYLVVRLFQYNIRAHWISWMLHHKKWPTSFIDHINGNRSDNRIENLREVDVNGNNRNQHWHRAGKVCGVCFENGKWRARITVCGGQINLGTYESFERAVSARKNAEKVEAEMIQEIRTKFHAALRAITEEQE